MPRRGARAAVLLVVSACVVTGCSTPADRFDSAVSQGYAAVQTARLAVSLELDGRAFPSVSTTALEDARRELIAASGSVSETQASSDADPRIRSSVLDALALGLEAVDAALDAAGGVGSLDAAAPALDDAADALASLLGPS